MSLVDPLYNAIFEGDCKRIDALLAGRNVNAGTGEDNLLRAALIGLTEAPNPNVIQHLIKLGVDVNAKDRYGWTPLHYAARKKSQAADPSLSTACVKLLIDAGADVNAKDNEGVTPMHRSVFECPWNLEMIEVLLAAGAKPTDNFCRFVNAVADDPEKNAVLALLSKFCAGPSSLTSEK
jgi:ankyrin repeat protein